MKKPIQLEKAEALFGTIDDADFEKGITESGWVCAFLAEKKSRDEAIEFAKRFSVAMDALLDYTLTTAIGPRKN